jgi:hypothetical protein
MSKAVAAVVVTYHPELAVLRRLLESFLLGRSRFRRISDLKELIRAFLNGCRGTLGQFHAG